MLEQYVLTKPVGPRTWHSLEVEREGKEVLTGIWKVILASTPTLVSITNERVKTSSLPKMPLPIVTEVLLNGTPAKRGYTLMPERT